MLKNSSGFSLAETLVALIIILLVSSVVAAGMPAAERAYVKVQESADAQVFLSTTLTVLRDELTTASDISVEGGNTVKYTNPVTGESSITLKDGNFIITTYMDIMDASEKEKYTRPLVSNSLKTNTMTLTYEGTPLFQYSNGVFTVAKLKVQTQSNAEPAKMNGSYTIQVLVPEKAA